MQKNLFTDIMTNSVHIATPKSKQQAAHYVSIVHDIASDTAHTNPENSNSVFVRGNTLTSIQLKLSKLYEACLVSTSEKNRNIHIISHTNKSSNNKLNNKDKTPDKN
jgi:hypothetical protein